LKTLFAIIILSISIFPSENYSQFSDAGITFIGKRNPVLTKFDSTSEVSVMYAYSYSGANLGDITFNSVRLEGDIHLSKMARVNVSLPFNLSSGPGGVVTGVGDALAAFTVYAKLGKSGIWGFTVGGKFATGNANSGGLPQSYQAGLGTNDLIVGISDNIKMVNICVAYQKPFGTSKNSLTGQKRGDDVMLRFGITQPIKKLNLQEEVFVIKRIQNTSLVVPGSSPLQYSVKQGTNELQVDLHGKLSYKFSPVIRTDIEGFVSLLSRNYNLDGLSKVYLLSLSAVYMW